MSKKIIGITVGTPINPDKFKGEGGSGDGGYVLTDTDKEEIANLTLNLIVNGEEVAY